MYRAAISNRHADLSRDLAIEVLSPSTGRNDRGRTCELMGRDGAPQYRRARAAFLLRGEHCDASTGAGLLLRVQRDQRNIKKTSERHINGVSAPEAMLRGQLPGHHP